MYDTIAEEDLKRLILKIIRRELEEIKSSSHFDFAEFVKPLSWLTQSSQQADTLELQQVKCIRHLSDSETASCEISRMRTESSPI